MNEASTASGTSAPIATAGPPAAAVSVLADRIRSLPGDRVIVGIAGSPGSGKTTLALAVVAELERREPGTAAHLPMDGFHLANATLDALGLRSRKGAPETFDGAGFAALLARVRGERGTVYAPQFDRLVDEGVAGSIAISPRVRVVVTEGNYLLIDAEPWRAVPPLLDEAWFCATPEDERMRRLVERHTRFGRSPAAAEAWAREVDGANAVLVEATRSRADLVIDGATGSTAG
ncbi:nucleoside/nucleotide kinase family protein [Arenivirga flava]|uniref:Nucleoside/nucleotide kinase family protein n=1 Tax=Arenivirga flava TaxID=1930060 RepID=A0AA37X9C7_9MICO|nr:nucleoside/nucleotide kinase family protein [Arenivirga flava]GMA28469.1 nucleoside/nucleotide kinase family protein [Arenivirga flava]